MKEIGSLKIDGNASCYKCGKGETCEKSVFRAKFGDDAVITPDVFYRYDEDQEAIDRATNLGKAICEAL